MPVFVAMLPRDADPDAYVRRHGRTALETVLAHASPLDEFVLEQLTTQASKTLAARSALALAAQLIHPVSQLLFLQKAEARLQFPAGSLSEALGIGDAARLRLEEILSQLVLTVPEVRAQLRGMTLPVRNPQLRELITRTLHQQSSTEERPDSLA